MEVLQTDSWHEALELKGAHPDAVPIAGGTDLGVQINKGMCDPAVIMSLAAVKELREIQLDDGKLVVGAMATLTDLERRSESLCPEFAASALRRSAASLAGIKASRSFFSFASSAARSVPRFLASSRERSWLS